MTVVQEWALYAVILIAVLVVIRQLIVFPAIDRWWEESSKRTGALLRHLYERRHPNGKD